MKVHNVSGYVLKTLRLFISYSSEDKHLTGEIKEELESYGLDVFVAHDDIEGGDNWEEETKNNLNMCDILLLILSKNFKQSDYTDQETGMALAWGKKIISLKVEIPPYGFANKWQAVSLRARKKYETDNEGAINDACKKIIDTIKKDDRFAPTLVDSMIKAAVTSKNWVDTNKICENLPPLSDLNLGQIFGLTNKGLDNLEFYRATDGIKLLKNIYKNYKFTDPELRNKLEKFIRSI